jgi:protein TonB
MSVQVLRVIGCVLLRSALVIWGLTRVELRAQDPLDTIKVYGILEVDVQPSFPGGEWEMNKFVERNTRNVEPGICAVGMTYIQFIVEKDGEISGVQVVKGFMPSFDIEAIRVVESMPRWTPARKDGEVVRAKCVVLVPYRVQ